MKFAVEYPHIKNLSPNEQVFVQLLREGQFTFATNYLATYKIDLDYLLKVGIILNKSDNLKEIVLSTKGITDVNKVTDWIEEYRSLFKGKKLGAMGSQIACVTKMQKFLKDYPQFADKDLILAAAKKYINSEARSNYIYLQRADYVISKKDSDSVNSRLAAFCEEVQGSVDKVSTINVSGRTNL